MHSRYGRAFSLSPFGSGVRGIPKSANIWDNRIEVDVTLKNSLTTSTGTIRQAIRDALKVGDLEAAKRAVLNFYWLKLGPHELLADQIQYQRDETGKRVKGRWGEDESEGYSTLTGIRNRILNVVRFGEDLEPEYVERLDTRLPGFSRNSCSRFLSAGCSWNRYGMCTYDCGPVFWSKKGFADFLGTVKPHMNKMGWPYKGTAYRVLTPLYHIALDYTKPPIRIATEPDNGYSLKSMRKRRGEIYRTLNRVLDQIHDARSKI